MKRKKYYLFLIIILIFTLSSCRKETAASPEPSGIEPSVSPSGTTKPADLSPSPSVPSESPEVPRENGTAAVEENVFEKNYELDRINDKKVKGELFISVPEISSEEYPQAAESISKYFNELKESHRDRFEAELEELTGRDEIGGESLPRYLDMSFRTEYNHGCIISFSFATGSYTGGAHDMTVLGSETFDLRDGSRITLDDLFTVDEETYSRRIKDNILEQMDEQAKDESSPFYENYAELMEHTFNKESFVLTEDGLCIYFQIYDLAPYAGGAFRFVIPYETLADILDPQYGIGGS